MSSAGLWEEGKAHVEPPTKPQKERGRVTRTAVTHEEEQVECRGGESPEGGTTNNPKPANTVTQDMPGGY